MKTEYKTLKVKLEEGIARLSVNRPDKLNALNETVLTELKTFQEEVQKNTEVRGVLFTGEGEKAFIAGADIMAMSEMNPEQAKTFAKLGQEVTRGFETLRVPVLACVQGFALGGGCEMALSADFIYATEKALFAQPEIDLGLIPGFGGTQRLGRYVGFAKAREMIMTGQKIAGEEAHRLGLVNTLFSTPDEMFEAAMKTLQTMSKKSPLIISRCKEVMDEGECLPIDSGLDVEARGFSSAFETQDTKEGLAAFLQKRRAEFQGK
mgnify:CR=1 FL=1